MILFQPIFAYGKSNRILISGEPHLKIGGIFDRGGDIGVPDRNVSENEPACFEDTDIGKPDQGLGKMLFQDSIGLPEGKAIHNF